MNYRKWLAEYVGTFALVFVGTGAIIVNQESNGMITHAGVSITFGAIVMGMILVFSKASGAHLNPAVSCAFFISGSLPARQFLLYAASQFLGALSASLSLRLLFPLNPSLGVTQPSISPMQTIALEFFLTFLLMAVILKVAEKRESSLLANSFIIGLVIALEALLAGPLTGASMNPARSFGPALVSGHMEHLWIYLVPTTLGAVGAVLLWKLVGSRFKTALQA